LEASREQAHPLKRETLTVLSKTIRTLMKMAARSWAVKQQLLKATTKVGLKNRGKRKSSPS
jgi:hypothetical protein